MCDECQACCSRRRIQLMCGRHPCEKPSCTHSEAHRSDCEARTVMQWTKQQRNAFYALVRKARGEAAARDLCAAVSEQWKKTGAAVPR